MTDLEEKKKRKRIVRLEFLEEELMMFAMVYKALLKETKKENIFEWIELRSCTYDVWEMIF